jgi:hypothetical protein
MTHIFVKSITIIDDKGGGSAYEWTVTEDGKIISEGTSPTILEAVMHAGNGTYNGWGYAKESGRLAIVGEKVQIVSQEECQQMAYETPTLTYCCNKEQPCSKHATILSDGVTPE